MKATVIMTLDVEYDDPTQVSDVVSVVAGEVRCRVVRNGARVTLDAAPGAAWEALAASQYRVCLRFAPYTAATATQHTVAAYVADPSTGTLGGADAPNRWAT